MPTADHHPTPERRAARDERRRAFARRLRELRRERGMTQEQVANAADVDRRWLVDVEMGRQSISLDRLWELAEALEVDVRELLAPPTGEDNSIA